MDDFDKHFARIEQQTKLINKGIGIVGCLVIGLYLSFWGFVVWAAYKVLQHFGIV